MQPNTNRRYIVAGVGTAALLLAGVVCVLAARPALATAQFAKDTGKACGACHTAAAGGGPLTAYGDKFHANGDKLPTSGGKP
jgi:mono/diheme cytochrome c family protein